MRRGDVEHRLDCQFHLPEHHALIKRINSSKYGVYRLGDKKISQHVIDGPFGSQLKVEEYTESGVPLIRVSNCRTGKVVDDSELVFISEEKHQQLIRSEVLPGDVLVTKAGHILGYTAVFPKRLVRGNITSHLASIRPSKGVLPEYLAAYLHSSLGIKQIYRWGNKATRPELNTDEVRQLLILLPPKEVQDNFIMDLEFSRTKFNRDLDTANANLVGIDDFLQQEIGITLIQKTPPLTFSVTLNNFEAARIDPHFYNPNFRKLVASIKSKPHDRLGNIIRFSNEQWNPTNSDRDSFSYIEIGGIDLRSGEIKPSELPTKGAPSRARMLVQAGDIIVSLTRPHRGAIALIGSNLHGAVASTGFAVLRQILRDDVSRDYLWCILRSQLSLQQMLQRSSGGNYPAITEAELKNIIIPIPSRAIQQRIVSEVKYRHNEAHHLRVEAEKEWNVAKKRFEENLIKVM